MRSCVLVSAFCILTCSLAHAGWVDLSANIPWPNDSMDLYSVYFIGQEGWISARSWGDTGFVFHTTDGGQTFETQHTQYYAYSVHMVTRLEGYACGAFGRVYRTTDGGANWNTLGTITTTALCIDFPPGCDTGYCCGYHGNIARVTPEGVTRMTSGVVSNMASISFPNNPRRGNVCGESVILQLQRDTWTAGYTYPFGTYNTICFVDSMTGWACGDSGLIVHTDDNANFVPQATPESIGLFGSCFVNSNCGWVVGGLGTIERTTDGGQHWRIEAPGMTDHFLTGVFAVDTGTAYVVGNRKVFLKYDGRGGIEETPNAEVRTTNAATVLRSVPAGAVVLDATGRRVLNPKPGVYFVRAVGCELSAASCQKVVLAR
jgi:photosystem II stability/assembly factor-like uncharacterized protein